LPEVGIRYGTGTPPPILTPSKDTVPFIRATDIKEGEIKTTELLHIDKEQPANLKKCRVTKGAMILVRSGVNTGDCAIVQSALQGAYAAYDLIIRFNEKVLPEFAATFLDTEVGRAQLNLMKGRAAQPHLNADEVASILIPLPPLYIQKKLVVEMETARESRKKKLQQADELLGGLDEWLMEKLGLTVASADQRTVFALRLKDLKGRRMDAPAYRPFFEKGRPPKTPLAALEKLAFIDAHSVDKPENDRELVPYVGLPECEQTEVRDVLMRPYSEVKGRSIVKSGDILFARIEPSIFNKKYILVEDLKGYNFAYTSTEFYVVTPNEGVVDPYYLYAMFFSSFLFNQARGKTTGSSGRRRLDPAMFRDLQIPTPPKEVQQAIAAEVRHRREEARRLRAEAEAEWVAAKERFENELLGGSNSDAVVLNAGKWQNKDRKESHDKGRDKKGAAGLRQVAKKPRGHKRAEKSLPGEDSGLGGDIHGVREGAGEYDPAEGTPRKGEGSTRPVDSTRYFETAQGKKTYSEVAEIVAVSVVKTIEFIVEQSPEDIHITPEWICKIHHHIAADLFPDWAGNFRAVNVEVGTHSPPPFYEVPVLMRLYCEDLAARLSSASVKMNLERMAEVLAFADWRFQWIHPFRDFNGRVGRILLSAVLFALRLPPTETAAVETREKAKYLKALRKADTGDMSELTEIWLERLRTAMKRHK
jgi:fido (protein-threonine AMPylation protein)